MSCLEVVPGVSVCYPELWVRRHILAELIFQSTADKDLWLKRKINTFKNIVFKRKRKRKATFSHNRMSSNNICLCIIFFIFFILLCIIVFEHLHVNTPLIYHVFGFCSILCWFFVDRFYVSSVYLTSSVPRWRTKNLTWPVCCISYFLFLSLSLPHSQLVIHHI